LAFKLGQSDTSTDPIFCSYPQFPGENKNDLFCKYSATTGVLVQDHDGGSCPANAVQCTPTTCAQQGATCGSIPDGCGNTLDCGSCTAPDTSCGGGGTPNQCGCTDNGAACSGRVCGSAVDNCGQHVSCGTCPANKTCCLTSCVSGQCP
jgi:hypothetical protein